MSSMDMMRETETLLQFVRILGAYEDDLSELVDLSSEADIQKRLKTLTVQQRAVFLRSSEEFQVGQVPWARTGLKILKTGALLEIAIEPVDRLFLARRQVRLYKRMLGIHRRLGIIIALQLYSLKLKDMTEEAEIHDMNQYAWDRNLRYEAVRWVRKHPYLADRFKVDEVFTSGKFDRLAFKFAPEYVAADAITFQDSAQALSTKAVARMFSLRYVGLNISVAFIWICQLTGLLSAASFGDATSLTFSAEMLSRALNRLYALRFITSMWSSSNARTQTDERYNSSGKECPICVMDLNQPPLNLEDYMSVRTTRLTNEAPAHNMLIKSWRKVKKTWRILTYFTVTRPCFFHDNVRFFVKKKASEARRSRSKVKYFRVQVWLRWFAIQQMPYTARIWWMTVTGRNPNTKMQPLWNENEQQVHCLSTDRRLCSTFKQCFHRECLDAWFESNDEVKKSCPYCRSEMPKDEQIDTKNKRWWAEILAQAAQQRANQREHVRQADTLIEYFRQVERQGKS